MNYYGQISLTKLGDWVRKHPEQVKAVTFADGHTEKLVNIDIRDRQQPGQHGSVAYISLYDKQSGEKEYIADLKVSQYGAAQTAERAAGTCVQLSAEEQAIVERLTAHDTD